jgi:hypothetical protein
MMTPVVVPLGHLRTALFDAQPAASGGLEITRNLEPLFALPKNDEGEKRKNDEGEKTAWCWAGYLPLLRFVLEESGFEVVVKSEKERPLPVPAWFGFGGMRLADLSFLEALRTRRRLLVRHEPERVQHVRFLEQIRRCWPGLRIVVIVGRQQEAVALCAALGGPPRGVVLATGGTLVDGEVDWRVCVGTPGSLGYVSVEIAHLLYFPCATMALRSQSLPHFGLARDARVVGFLDRRAQPSIYERDRLPGFFGFEELALPGHGLAELKVEVVWVKVKGGPPIDKGLDIVGIKRQGIWRHPVRNRRIVALAKAIRQNRGRLEREFPAVALALAQVANPRVLILVESFEHAAVLAARLPGWSRRTGAQGEVGKVGANGEAANGRGTRNRARQADEVIATFADLKHLRLADYDVLIRADGGVGVPQLPLDQSVWSTRELARRTLLVDFDDRHQPLLARWSRARRRIYEARRWLEAGVSPAVLAFEEFMRRRDGDPSA